MTSAAQTHDLPKFANDTASLQLIVAADTHATQQATAPCQYFLVRNAQAQVSKSPVGGRKRMEIYARFCALLP